MKKNILIVITSGAVLISLIYTVASSKQKSDVSEAVKTVKLPNELKQYQESDRRLKSCTEKNLRIKYLCDFSWVDLHENPDMMFVDISENPSVKFKFLKIDIDILTIHQLSREKLQAIGQYGDGFVTEATTVAGYEAIKVKAFARENPDVRLTDYYFVKDHSLYSVMFSVNPKTEWDNFQFTIRDIVNSIEFMS